MNKKTIEITEDDLHAYVDNQLPVEKIEAVEALICADAKIAQQIHDWQEQNKLLSDLYGNKDYSDIPKKLDINSFTQKKTNKGSKRFLSLAASVLLVLFGGLIGWFASDISQPQSLKTTNFVNSAISAYQVYSVEVLHPVEVGADKRKHLVNWLSKRVNYPLTIPNLQKYGYKLLGGRLLAMRKGKPAAQFMFENKEGKRITMLVSKNPEYLDQSLHLKKENKVNAFYWMDNQVAYSITGKIQSKSLRELSTAVYQQLNMKKPRQLAGL